MALPNSSENAPGTVTCTKVPKITTKWFDLITITDNTPIVTLYVNDLPSTAWPFTLTSIWGCFYPPLGFARLRSLPSFGFSTGNCPVTFFTALSANYCSSHLLMASKKSACCFAFASSLLVCSCFQSSSAFALSVQTCHLTTFPCSFFFASASNSTTFS